MLTMRSRKVVRDLRQQWGRAVLVIVAIRWAIAAWLTIVTVLSTLAGIVPARRAAAMTISDTLAYE